MLARLLRIASDVSTGFRQWRASRDASVIFSFNHGSGSICLGTRRFQPYFDPTRDCESLIARHCAASFNLLVHFPTLVAGHTYSRHKETGLAARALAVLI